MAIFKLAIIIMADDPATEIEAFPGSINQAPHMTQCIEMHFWHVIRFSRWESKRHKGRA
jgi:hypothetical protein